MADQPERHHTQYFEMFGSRAIYHRGWKAVTFKPLGPMYDDGRDWMGPFDEDPVGAVPRGSRPVRDARPGGRGARPAGRDGRAVVGRGPRQPGAAPGQPGALHHPQPPPQPAARTASSYRYLPHGAPVPEAVAVDVRNRSHRILVDADFGSRGRRGAAGPGIGAGRAGRCTCSTAGCATPTTCTASRSTCWRPTRRWLPAATRSGFAFDRTAEHAGDIRLWCDDQTLATGRIERFTPAKFTGTGVGLTCGYEMGPAVGPGLPGPVPLRRRHPRRGGGGHRSPGSQPPGRVRGHHVAAVTP